MTTYCPKEGEIILKDDCILDVKEGFLVSLMACGSGPPLALKANDEGKVFVLNLWELRELTIPFKNVMEFDAHLKIAVWCYENGVVLTTERLFEVEFTKDKGTYVYNGEHYPKEVFEDKLGMFIDSEEPY